MRSDQIRLDQIRKDQIGSDQIGSDQIRSHAHLMVYIHVSVAEWRLIDFHCFQDVDEVSRVGHVWRARTRPFPGPDLCEKARAQCLIPANIGFIGMICCHRRIPIVYEVLVFSFVFLGVLVGVFVVLSRTVRWRLICPVPGILSQLFFGVLCLKTYAHIICISVQ